MNVNEFLVALIGGVAGGVIVAACIIAGAFVDEWRQNRRRVEAARRERIDRMTTVATHNR